MDTTSKKSRKGLVFKMKLFLVLIIFVIFTFLFYKAAGTLSLKKINIISFSYYSIVIYSYIGASLVYLGFREHYLIQKISDETIINKTFYILSYAIVIFVLGIISINKVFKKKGMKDYKTYIETPVNITGDGKNIFYAVLCISIICILATIYVFLCIGYVSLVKVFESGFDTAVARVEINRNFSGNIYIKNLVCLVITPLLSYISYIYYRVTKEKRWLYLLIIQVILCILIKTHDFSKSPILYYLIGFYLIEVILGNIKSLKRIVIFGIVISIIIIIQYGGLNKLGSFMTIYSGPLGRIFMTQIATLFLHVQAFPQQMAYLRGASFPTILSKLIGVDQSWIRSGRVVMEIYNPTGVENGTAGVMNTIFVGEAYANWGLVGVFISPIIVAIIIAFIFNYSINAKKTPINIVLYIALLQIFTSCLQGGFIDFLYNASAIVIVIVLKGIQILGNNGRIRSGVYRRVQ